MAKMTCNEHYNIATLNIILAAILRPNLKQFTSPHAIRINDIIVEFKEIKCSTLILKINFNDNIIQFFNKDHDNKRSISLTVSSYPVGFNSSVYQSVGKMNDIADCMLYCLLCLLFPDCAHLITTKQTWVNARQQCLHLGMNLTGSLSFYSNQTASYDPNKLQHAFTEVESVSSFPAWIGGYVKRTLWISQDGEWGCYFVLRIFVKVRAVVHAYVTKTIVLDFNGLCYL